MNMHGILYFHASSTDVFTTLLPLFCSNGDVLEPMHGNFKTHFHDKNKNFCQANGPQTDLEFHRLIRRHWVMYCTKKVYEIGKKDTHLDGWLHTIS